MKPFINEIARCIYIADPEQKILPSLIIAQACLESNYGKSKLAIEAKNLFGVKGKGYTINTKEYLKNEYVTVKAEFQLYNSWQDSVNDQVRRFTKVSRYSKIPGIKDYKLACNEVYKAGYATDPRYPSKLISVIESNKLYEYDQKEGVVLVNRNKIIEAALMLQSKNIKYKLGAKAMPPTIPKTLDCSGFVRYCYKLAGADIPDGTWYQWHASNSIKASDLKLGDLGFKHDPEQERGINHIGIYMGDGKWIHCNASRNGITLEKTNIFPYARRVKGISFTNVKLEDGGEMERKPVTEKDLNYGIAAINNLAKLKIINSPERHIADLKEYPWDWKMWVVQNNIAEKCGGAK